MKKLEDFNIIHIMLRCKVSIKSINIAYRFYKNNYLQPMEIKI